MLRNLVCFVVFLAGIAAVVWIGAGYAGSNPLGLAMAVLIGACYLVGAFELWRYRRATATLARAVSASSEASGGLEDWLGQVPPALRNVVRLRVEGERVAMPGPTLTSYLVGLLVLLGMLGTLLGMMETLRGTGMALESATDLQAMRSSLAAPVKGLGFAFGTSIAGVATSAMLGLLSVLCRRERLRLGPSLDAKVATTWRRYSRAHQREETFKLLQRQADVMPALVDRLQAMMTAMEQHGEAASERQLASQQAFQDKTEAAYLRLAGSVDQTLKDSVAAGAKAAGAALQPVVETTMAAVARETASMQDAVTQAVQRQLQGLTAGFETAAATVAEIWQRALAEHRQANEALAGQLHRSLDRFATTSAQQSAEVLQGVFSRLDSTADGVAEAWRQALARQDAAGERLASHHQQALTAAVASFEQQAVSLIHAVDRSHGELRASLAEQEQQRLASLGETLGALTASLGEHWTQTRLDGASQQQEICAALARTAGDMAAQAKTHVSETVAEVSRLLQVAAEAPKAAAAAAASFDQRAAELVRAVDQAHAELRASLAAQEQQRLAGWTETLGAMTATLSNDWARAGADSADRQQAICDALARTAADISAQTQAHASETIAEISRLVQAASEAPKAAAEVVAELRQKLSESMVRDTAMLEERTRLMETLETLLQAVNHASAEQRSAVDALIATSADLLDRVGTRFSAHIEAETGKLGAVATQVSVGAAEVASLGDALGAAVKLFGESNEKLAGRLQGIEGALDKSLVRSDEQLAYYVAQAREVVDLSVLSQQQIIEELQRLARRRGAAGERTA